MREALAWQHGISTGMVGTKEPNQFQAWLWSQGNGAKGRRRRRTARVEAFQVERGRRLLLFIGLHLLDRGGCLLCLPTWLFGFYTIYPRPPRPSIQPARQSNSGPKQVAVLGCSSVDKCFPQSVHPTVSLFLGVSCALYPLHAQHMRLLLSLHHHSSSTVGIHQNTLNFKTNGCRPATTSSRLS